MNYIINPSVFYWMNVLNSLVSVSILLLIIGSIGIIVFGVIGLVDHACMGEEEATAIKKVFRLVVSMFVVGLLGIVFIPDKQTMMEMLIAKTATVENAEWTIDSLKSVVDYIVQAAQNLK